LLAQRFVANHYPNRRHQQQRPLSAAGALANSYPGEQFLAQDEAAGDNEDEEEFNNASRRPISNSVSGGIRIAHSSTGFFSQSGPAAGRHSQHNLFHLGGGSCQQQTVPKSSSSPLHRPPTEQQHKQQQQVVVPSSFFSSFGRNKAKKQQQTVVLGGAQQQTYRGSSALVQQHGTTTAEISTTPVAGIGT
jgi:hypothetical protein